MALQEPEVSDEIEVRGSEFQLSQPDHFSQITLAVAPIKSNRWNRRPGPRGVAFPSVLRQIVERQRAESLSPDDDPSCFRVLLQRRSAGRRQARLLRIPERSQPLDCGIQRLRYRISSRLRHQPLRASDGLRFTIHRISDLLGRRAALFQLPITSVFAELRQPQCLGFTGIRNEIKECRVDDRDIAQGARITRSGVSSLL